MLFDIMDWLMIRVSPVIGMLAATLVHAQPYVISTVAGGGPILRTPTAALNVPIFPGGVAVDAKGNVYFASSRFVFKLDPSGLLTRIAGNYPDRPTTYSGDGGPATEAVLSPAGVAVSNTGDIFIADFARVRRVAPGGIITTVAGNGIGGFSGDGGPATDAQLQRPSGVAVDGAGNLFVADFASNRIRKVSPSGIITTVAGNGTRGFSGDGGPATSAQLWFPEGIAVDSQGNLFIADHANNRVRKVSPNGIITTVAGIGSAGFSGDGGPATSAQLNGTFAVAVDNAGNLYIEDHDNWRIRKVSGGIITTFAGGGAGLGDGGPATSAMVGPAAGLALDSAGDLFIADTGRFRIRKVATDGIITTIAGTGAPASSFSGDGGPAIDATLAPRAVAVDDSGALFIADRLNHRVRKVSVDGIITTIAGNGTQGFSGDAAPAVSAHLESPRSLAVGLEGSLFIADTDRIRKVSSNGIISTVAGGGTLSGGAADGGPATSAQIDPWSLAADKLGNLFIADASHNRIRRVSPDGTITTVAGDGTAGPPRDGGPAAIATVSYPTAVAVGSEGSLFIAEGHLFIADGAIRVRKVSADGIIRTVAGGESGNCSLDGVQATSILLCYVSGVAVDSAGNLFISTSGFDDGPNERVRKVAPDGIITTVAGTGPGGFSGDGGLAVDAKLSAPSGVAVDFAGNVYVADEGNGVVRILRPIQRPVWIAAVVDAASQRAAPVATGKLVVIYGSGLGPAQLVSRPNQSSAELGGTVVYFNGTPTTILYSSTTQVAAMIPDVFAGTTAQIAVAYHGDLSDPFTVQVAASAPGLFTANQSGSGQAAALNGDGTVNSPANPVRIGDSITLYATGEGFVSIQDPPYSTACDALLHPSLPVGVSIGGIQATLRCAGRRPDEAVMRVIVQVPNGVQPGGYVPVVLKVGDSSTTPDAVWIALSAN
jgi:uncharacterized protein (TIGR03437 family)